MFDSAGRFPSKPAVLFTAFVIAGLVLFFIGAASQVASQTTGSALSGASGESQRQLGELRRQRDRLEQNVREQQKRTSQLLDEEKDLLAQQAQLQQRIGQAERELKLPQLPAEYQTKKCKLLELQAKQQQTQEQIARDRQETARIQQATGRIQGQISQIQQQISQTQQQINQQAEAERQAQEQARQQQATSSSDPMASRMTTPLNPLAGLSPTVAPLTATTGSSSGALNGCPGAGGPVTVQCTCPIVLPGFVNSVALSPQVIPACFTSYTSVTISWIGDPSNGNFSFYLTQQSGGTSEGTPGAAAGSNSMTLYPTNPPGDVPHTRPSWFGLPPLVNPNSPFTTFYYSQNGLAMTPGTLSITWNP